MAGRLCLLIGWDVCAGLYLVFAFHIMSKADVHRMRRQARLQDEGQIGILILTAVAALASLGRHLRAARQLERWHA